MKRVFELPLMNKGGRPKNPDKKPKITKSEVAIIREENKRFQIIPIGRQPYKEPLGRYCCGEMDITCLNCGALYWINEKLKNCSISNPIFDFCCRNGVINLPSIPELPEYIEDLLACRVPES